MTFKDYLNDAWNIHPTESEKLLNEFRNHFSLIQSNDDVVSLAHLITHVSGDHLGKWNEGLSLLQELKKHSFATDANTMDRYISILSLANDGSYSLNQFNGTDQIRIKASTASAVCAFNPTRAMQYLNESMKLAEGVEKQDPGNRAIAIAGNNIAATLGDLETRTNDEVELMIAAANAGRKYWELAGNWMNVERAEYRLALTFLKAGKPDVSLSHAENCLKVIQENGNDPFESFFGYEVLALAEKARNNQENYLKAKSKMEVLLSAVADDMKSYCQEVLSKV